VAGAANALRQERDEATLFVAGNRSGDRGVLDIGNGQADGEIEEMTNALRGTGELDPATLSAQQRAEEALGRLDRLRASVNGDPPIPYDQVVSRYSDIIGQIDALDRGLLRQLRTPATAGLADALTSVTGVVEHLSIEHTVLGAAIRSGKPLPTDPAVVNAANAQLAADYQDYQASLTPAQLGTFGTLPDASANSRRDQLRTAILAAPYELQPLQADWDAAYAASRGAADRTAEQIRAELVAASTAAEDRASNLAGINSVILMLGLLAGISIAVLVARGFVRSLRVLRTSALDVAERRLPQTVESVRAGDTPDVTVAPVPLSGRDEIGQVARAFDAVHRQAIRLAADQATLQAGISAMFVNLSRRSQALVERQLQLIERLESNEQDADQLSNLFQLDHLATRMRRNSENLLVLAGTDVAKRNVAAVPMVDVLRAAVSEVEQYQRIVVQTPPTATILGRAASDIVHLLAELLDNATNFSPPDSQVVMSSTRTADGALVVEIADRGVGMTDDELVAANSRLSGPASVDVSTSRRMGLIVVGRLAARHGVDVHLSSSAAGGSGSGLTASVTVPTKLVPTSEPRRSGTMAGSGMARQPGGPTATVMAPPRNGVPARPGAPLAALVAGSDGPDTTTGTPADQPGAPGSPPPSTNGSVNGLPTRRPGSSLRTAGNSPFDRRGPEQEAAAGPPERVEPPAPPAGPPADRRPDEVADGDRPPATAPDEEPAVRDESTDDAEPSTPPDGLPKALPAPRAGAAERPAPFAAAPNGRPDGRNRAAEGPRDATDPAGVARTGSQDTPEPARAAAPDTDAGQHRTAPRTDPTPVVERTGQDLRRPTPQRRPATPRPFPRDDVPGRPNPAQRPGGQQAGDGLFASGAPAMPEPAAAARTGPRFDPNETTPIFEEIASAWFRSNRSVPVQYGPDQNQPAPAAPQPARPAPVPPPLSPAMPAALRPAPTRGPTPPPVAPSEPMPSRSNQEEPATPQPVGADQGFASLADEGWRAARGMTAARGDELTPAGLPKRRPRARLVPGSAGSAVLAPPAAPSRSAESVRGRLASYQQGVRMGRENRQRGDAESTAHSNGGTEQANPQGNHDEESS
jgi:signal transduction histidine kinase